MQIDRRGLIGTGMASAAMFAAMRGSAVSAADATSSRGSGQPLELDSVAGRQRALMLLRGALDENLVMSWVSARYYGVIEDRMDPLFAVVSAVFSRFRQASDGAWEVYNAEIAWFTDADTGKALDTYTNPYTGESVKVPQGGYPPSKLRIGTDLSLHLEREIPGLTMEHEVLPFDVRGDDVWVTERSRTAMAVPGADKPFRYSESNTFHASKAAMEAPGATRVPVQVSFTNVCSWRPWLNMDGRPGHLTAIGVGGHNASWEQFPPAWIEATRARRPEVLKDPAALLAPLWDD